ncbi:MAG: hypothetical protein M1837_002044 [Sclerophora amabilis]|nr:MAG: hypothetical protein M1837_002044 [Sclerophora amabilis]
MDAGFTLPKPSSMFMHSSNDPYTYPSSSASSSSSSIFSADGASSQTSSASSASSLQVVWETETAESVPGTGSEAPERTTSRVHDEESFVCPRVKQTAPRTEGLVVPPEQRLNPRRTSRVDSRGQCPVAGTCRPPPPLVRQSDRKIHFVDNLVDSATQIVQAIWPLSVVVCRSDSALGNKGVLPLRTFIQETLRRSRTSYSTLQVALYYLILIKSHVPTHDFTMEQPGDEQAVRALQCGRRMFLAALILASKYLQDRNYSARAWSKISGLHTHEINLNEMTFLSAVKWRLHISDSVFQRWTDVVLKYTSPSPPSSPTSSPIRANEKMGDWVSIISRLSPELDNVELGPSASAGTPSLDRLSTPVHVKGMDSTVPSPRQSGQCPKAEAFMPAHEIPRVLEPTPIPCPPLALPLPPLTRLAPLPTPQLTPHVADLTTPAASNGSSTCSRRSSIGNALAQAQTACTTRTTLDRWASLPSQGCGPYANVIPPMEQAPLQITSHVRRSSLARSCSLASSPESMISDSSSRSSRSSSISSVSSSICAPSQAKLAVQATCRNAKLCQRGTNENAKLSGCAQTGAEQPAHAMGWNLARSPDAYGSPVGIVPDFANFSLSTPREMPVQPTRQGFSTPNLEDLSTPIARRSHASRSRSAMESSKGRKRGRTPEGSVVLQHHVRDLLGTNGKQQDDRTVVADSAVACSYLLPTPTLDSEKTVTDGVRPRALQSPSRLLPPRVPLQKEMGRKRACCGEEVAKLSSSMNNPRVGPGMWEGVL